MKGGKREYGVINCFLCCQGGENTEKKQWMETRIKAREIIPDHLVGLSQPT
jgi:hypothetical protein